MVQQRAFAGGADRSRRPRSVEDRQVVDRRDRDGAERGQRKVDVEAVEERAGHGESAGAGAQDALDVGPDHTVHAGGQFRPGGHADGGAQIGLGQERNQGGQEFAAVRLDAASARRERQRSEHDPRCACAHPTAPNSSQKKKSRGKISK